MNNAGIAFIGGGNMAASLIAGLIADGHAPTGLWVSEPDALRRDGLRERFGVQVVADNRDALAHAETLVLCVKPQLAPGVCRELGDLAAGLGLLVISVMAGVPESGLQRWLGAPLPVVRTMPNTPAMVQTGAIGLHAAPRSPRRVATGPRPSCGPPG